jgi:hypothetical protein
MEGRAVMNRTLLYRLESYGYSKDDEDAIERIVDRGRRAGKISWDAISDGRSTVDAPWEIEDEADFRTYVRGLIDDLQLRRQRGQRQFIEIFTESAGQIATLARVAHPYGITVYSSSGFDTTTARYKAAMRALRRAPRRTVVLHVGDHDRSGVVAFNSFRLDVQAHVRDGLLPLLPDHDAAVIEEMANRLVEVRRAAILPSQIRHYRVQEKPWKPMPRRGGHPDLPPPWAEVEALLPQQLETEVTKAIEDLTDRQILDDVIAQGEPLRARLHAWLDRADEDEQ